MICMVISSAVSILLVAYYMDIFNYDKNNLICYDMTVYYRDGEEKDKEFYHSIISRRTVYTLGISIPFKTVKAPFVRQGDVITATNSTCSYTLSK